MNLAVLSIIYGALTAWAQSDAIKLLAYSSISHMGYIVIGCIAITNKQLVEEAVIGSIYQMINYSLSSGALFLLIGILYERRKTHKFKDLAGLVKNMPYFRTALILATLGSIGLPGTGFFISQFLILLGVLKSNYLYAILTSLGFLFSTIYMLYLCKEIIFSSEIKEKNETIKDLNSREIIFLSPFAFLIIIMGLYPSYFLNKTKSSVRYLTKNYQNYHLKVAKKNKLTPKYVLSTSKRAKDKEI